MKMLQIKGDERMGSELFLGTLPWKCSRTNYPALRFSNTFSIHFFASHNIIMKDHEHASY